MKRYKNLLISSLSAPVVASTLAAIALAQDSTSDSKLSDAAAVSIFGGMMVFLLIIGAIAVITLVFWIFMLVDALKRTNWESDSQKTTWLVVLIISLVIGFHFIGALVYYFAVYRSLGKASSK